MKSILDRSFKYTPAAKTDISRLFKRIRREQEQNAKEAQSKVEPIKRGVRFGSDAQ